MVPSNSGSATLLARVVAVVSAVAIVLCGAAAALYAQGMDPLAWLSPAALTTVADEPEAKPAAGEAASAPAAGEKGQEPVAHPAPTDAPSDGTASAPADSAAPEPVASADQAPASEPAAPAQHATPTDAAQSPQSEAPATITVTVGVDGSAAAGSSYAVTVTLPAGPTAYDALLASGADVSAVGSAYGMYVRAIDGLAEKEHGTMSGWLYAVNGVSANRACSAYVLGDGDSVSWWYGNVEY